MPGKKTAVKPDNGLFHPSFLISQLKCPWRLMNILFDHCDVFTLLWPNHIMNCMVKHRLSSLLISISNLQIDFCYSVFWEIWDEDAIRATMYRNESIMLRFLVLLLKENYKQLSEFCRPLEICTVYWSYWLHPCTEIAHRKPSTRLFLSDRLNRYRNRYFFQIRFLRTKISWINLAYI